jgi:UDP-N-acetyl-D-mannosaminuronic acid dehydrogenase
MLQTKHYHRILPLAFIRFKYSNVKGPQQMKTPIESGQIIADMKVSIIGGGGHVGLAMALVLVDADHDVVLVDQNKDILDTIEAGKLPYHEPEGERLLRKGLSENRMEFSTDVSAVAGTDVVVTVVGTPIDEHNNPQMESLLNLIEELKPHLSDGQLLLLRSTVYPGTTQNVTDALERDGIAVGSVDTESDGLAVSLAFTPERVAQHDAIAEMVELPQLIGAVDDASYDHARAFFNTFLEAECPRLSPTEAEIGKLFTNMWRYITFATANEFFLIADSFAADHDVNVHRILDQSSRGYPRFDVPSPGANVGGPCLTKDGWFLVDDIPYNELVSTAYQINEGLPAQVVRRMARAEPDPDRITVLGMTFKRDSDDVRNSVSFKMIKFLRRKGYDNVVRIEPNRDGFDDWAAAEGSDWVVLMTPHSEFADFETVAARIDNPDCLYCDIWGHWDEPRYESDNGYFYGREFLAQSAESGDASAAEGVGR